MVIKYLTITYIPDIRGFFQKQVILTDKFKSEKQRKNCKINWKNAQKLPNVSDK